MLMRYQIIHKNLQVEALEALETLAHNDHVWFLNNLQKGKATSILSQSVVAVLRRYLLRECFELEIDPNNRRLIRKKNGEIIYLSISHSKNSALVALSLRAPLGVDVEFVGPRRYADRIARRFFPEENIHDINSFLKAWTAREAFVKAQGCGIDRWFSSIKTRRVGDELLIGFNNNLAYRVTHFSRDDGAIVAVCRESHLVGLKFFEIER